jgi:branched-chain amino acid transport system substrate-binding protein
MNQVAIKEAASIRYPMDHFIGIWWSASENDVLPAGDAADGYLAAAVHAPGANFQVHKDILKYLYDKNKGAGERDRVGEVLYNRGLAAAMWTSEAIRTAMKMYNTNNPTAAQVRDGFENLNVDEARLAELGFKDFTYPIHITCANHSGPGKAAIQQWNAKTKSWKIVSKWYDRMSEITDPLIKEDSEAYAKESNITPRDCK